MIQNDLIKAVSKQLWHFVRFILNLGCIVYEFLLAFVTFCRRWLRLEYNI